MIEQPTDTAESNMERVIRANVGYIGAELTAGRWTALRFLRFRPDRELRDMLAVAEAHARAVAEADPDVVDVESRVGEDAVVSTLRDAVRVHAPANQIAGCPPGYEPVPYPLGVEDRERLYDATSRILVDVMPRHLPGGDQGWSWRVEPTVAKDGSALILRLTPRNERFEDPIVHGETPEEQLPVD